MRRASAVSKRPDMWQVSSMEALDTSRYSELFPRKAGLHG